jgi:hypothetical protein
MLKPDPFAPGRRSEMSLESRPEYAKALGELCADWAMMELKLFGVFASLTGAPLLMSRTIFYSLHTTRARCDMVMALANAVLGKADESDTDHPVNTLKRLLSAINRSASKRNAYVHDTWIAPHDHEDATAQLRLSGSDSRGQIEETKPRDLAQLANQARVHSDSLARWVTAIDDKLPGLLEIHRKQQSLALELIRTGTPRKRS